MAGNNSNEFLTALAVGTALGVGAAILLRPSPRSARERLLREIRPYREQLRNSAADARRALESTAEAASDLSGDSAEMTDAAIQVGRELLAEFREEVRRILEEAREELSELGGPTRAGRARWELEERLERRLGERRLDDRRWFEDEDAEDDQPGEDEYDAAAEEEDR
jgi:gas vesicle protein